MSRNPSRWLLAAVVSLLLSAIPQPVLAAVCFHDQFENVYYVEVQGDVQNAFDLFVAIVVPPLAPPLGTGQPGTLFGHGGGVIRNGKAEGNWSETDSGTTFSMNPPNFDSGVGTHFLSGQPNASFVFSPAACPAAFP